MEKKKGKEKDNGEWRMEKNGDGVWRMENGNGEEVGDRRRLTSDPTSQKKTHFSQPTYIPIHHPSLHLSKVP